MSLYNFLYRLFKGYDHLYTFRGIRIYFSRKVLRPKRIKYTVYLPIRYFTLNLQNLMSNREVLGMVRIALSKRIKHKK